MWSQHLGESDLSSSAISAEGHGSHHKHIGMYLTLKSSVKKDAISSTTRDDIKSRFLSAINRFKISRDTCGGGNMKLIIKSDRK